MFLEHFFIMTKKKFQCFYFAIFDYTLLALFWLKFLNKFMMGIYALGIDFISLYKDKLWHLFELKVWCVNTGWNCWPQETDKNNTREIINLGQFWNIISKI